MRERDVQREVARYLEDVGQAVSHHRERRGWDQERLAQGRICVALNLAPEHLGLPRGLLGQVTRDVCDVLGLDLTGRQVEAPPQVGKPGVPAPPKRKVRRRPGRRA